MKTKFTTLQLTQMGLTVALISVCSYIVIPLPMVSFTMQTFGVYLSLLLLGGKMSTYVVGVYLLLGGFGLPIFAGMKGGLGILFGNTGGYLLGFIAMTLLYWGVTSLLGDSSKVRVVALILGTILCYAFGTVWFVFMYNSKVVDTIGILTALTWCVTPFIIPDLGKIYIANIVYQKIKFVNKPDLVQ